MSFLEFSPSQTTDPFDYFRSKLFVAHFR